MSKVACPKCFKVFDSEIEYEIIHWPHSHYGPVPAPLTQPAPASNLEEAPSVAPVEEPQTAEPEAEAYSLSASKAGLGELSPVLKDAFGNIIDGFHRKGENADWREEILPWIDTPEKLEAARLAVNFNRRKMAPEEIKERVTFLVGKGLKPEEIAKTTGISERTIRKYTPQEFKNPTYVAMAIQSNAARVPRTVNLTEQETKSPITTPATAEIPVQPESVEPRGFISSDELTIAGTPKEIPIKAPTPELLLTGFEVECPECHKKLLINHKERLDGKAVHIIEG